MLRIPKNIHFYGTQDMKLSTMLEISRLKGSRSLVKIERHHLPLIKRWYRARGLPVPKSGHFSTLGYIADGRVAGWLHLMNSDLAMIEGVIADPFSVPSLRRESLNKLIGTLVDTALSLGYPTIIGISNHESILSLGKKYGFKELKDFKVIILDTSGDE